MPTANGWFLLLPLMGVLVTGAQPANRSQAPSGHEARKTQLRALLNQGRFNDAMPEAVSLNREMPDDLETYAMLAETYRQLGEMEQAEKSLQWMLDLRPESPVSLLAAAEFRFAVREYAGAIDFYNEAYRRTARQDLKRRSEILLLAVKAYRAAGRNDAAEKCIREAARLREGEEGQ
jgi:tetratricopeptide (TPR) repeat protein